MMLAAGEYDFEIVKAEEKTSQKGNAMIVVDLKVFPTDGTAPRFVRDYLVSSMELKLNRFCRCVGLEDAYNEGAVTAFACEGVAGRVKLGCESSTEYGDKNVVKDYVVPKAGEAATAPAAKASPDSKTAKAVEFEDQLAAAGDDIPF